MPSPPAASPHRAWAAYLRQELTAPAAALAEYARDLEARAVATDDAAAIVAAGRIRNRAEHLSKEVEKLTAEPAKPCDQSSDYWRQVRHDLRGAASFVVMACEDVLEGATPEVRGAIAADAERTLAAARKAIDLVEAVIKFGQSPGAPPEAAVREMLSRLTTEPKAGVAGRILIVDDNEFGRDLIARMLIQQGHSVEVEPGGQEALDRLMASHLPPIDLILLDVMMPGMTGPEVLAWLKAMPAFWHLPVIMVSALGEDEGVLACIAAGAEDYLTRPVKPQLLQARIAGCLEKKRLRDREGEYQARIHSLVRAIFPPAVVTEWEQTGEIQPRHHESVGVLFLDVVGFTAYCEQYRDDPGQVIHQLQSLVELFEATVDRHGVQKIKTIGDAFLGVAGLPDPVPNPAETLLKCGLDLVADAASHPAKWQVRVGIHVGPVVTGVLGKAQFSFDVWGHTVNAAARVESHGRPGSVTLSDEAWRLVAPFAAGDDRQVAARGIGVMTVWDFLHWNR